MKKGLLSWGFALVGVLGLLSSCGSNEPAEPVPPIVPDTRMMEYLDAQTRTADEVFSALTENLSESKNMIFSPFSFYTGISMLASGMDDESREEVLKLLNVSDLETLDRYNSQLISNFPNLDRKVVLKIANSMWLDETLSYNSVYSGNLADWYACEAKNINFRTSDARDIINRWIGNRTNGMITEYLEDDYLLDFMCVNAIYFEAAWTTPFNKSKTEEADFTLATGKKIWVDMMHNSALEGYYSQTDRDKVLTLTFGNKCFNITFALPAEGIGMHEYLAQLKDEGFHNLSVRGLPATVDVKLPKIEMSTKYRMDECLKSLGLNTVFKTKEWNRVAEGLTHNLTSLSHAVAFKMDEEGAKAAAVTGQDLVTSPGPQVYPEFTADRPFVFVITEKACNVPLFMGVVNTL